MLAHLICGASSGRIRPPVDALLNEVDDDAVLQGAPAKDVELLPGIGTPGYTITAGPLPCGRLSHEKDLHATVRQIHRHNWGFFGSLPRDCGISRTGIRQYTLTLATRGPTVGGWTFLSVQSAERSSGSMSPLPGRCRTDRPLPLSMSLVAPKLRRRLMVGRAPAQRLRVRGLAAQPRIRRLCSSLPGSRGKTLKEGLTVGPTDPRLASAHGGSIGTHRAGTPIGTGGAEGRPGLGEIRLA